MIPIGDRLRSRTFPYVNHGIIAVNLALFLYELMLSSRPALMRGRLLSLASPRDNWIYSWGRFHMTSASTSAIPARMTGRCLERLITSQFIHAGWLHVLGNMLCLWVFGDNVEDALGHLRCLAFCLLRGMGAAVAQVYFDRNAIVPLVGASGAIAGVLGSYLALYPGASVSVIIPVFIIPIFARVAAVWVMLVWFLTQLISLAPTANASGGSGGVAYAAHVGGFGLDLLLGRLLATKRRSVPG